MQSIRPFVFGSALALVALAGCTSSTPTASRFGSENDSATPQTHDQAGEHAQNHAATGGEEQFAAATAQQAQGAALEGGPGDDAVNWVHSAAANAFALRPGYAPIPPDGSEALTPNIPAEDPDAMMVDGMESLLQQTFAGEGSDFDPNLSRDGKWLVFSSTQHRPTPDVYIKRVGSRTVTQLTADPSSDVMPSLSPDASRIAFCSNRSGWWNLYVMSVSGGQAVQLSTTTAHDLHPTWSPDGKHLAFCRLGQVSGRWELWVMNVSQPQSAEFVGYGMFPRWCPVAGTGENGTDKILFQRGRERGSRAFSLWTIDYKPGWASNPTEIVNTRNAAAITADWDPTGEWLVYSTVPSMQAQGNSPRPPADLWITSINGSERVNLTGGKFSNLMPTWSVDGRIYFVSDRGGQEQVWSIATDKALAAAGAKSPNMKGDTATAPTE